MKKVFLLIVVPALLVALGFAQTPAASGNTDQINIEGCLAGADGNYTIAEDNTGKIFKITTSGADLKAYVGQEVKLIGNKAGTAENNLAVTEFNMISEHCAASAAVPAATVSTTPETISPPAAPAAAPVPDGTTRAPVSNPPDTVTAPAAVAPAAPVNKSSQTASAPAATAVAHRTQPAALPQKASAKPAAEAAPVEPASSPAPVAAASPAHVDSPAETANDSPLAAPAVAPTKPATTGRSTWMLVSIVVVVLLIGGAVPLYNRWRKQKLLKETSSQNLSFTHRASSDPGTSDTPAGRKAA